VTQNRVGWRVLILEALNLRVLLSQCLVFCVPHRVEVVKITGISEELAASLFQGSIPNKEGASSYEMSEILIISVRCDTQKTAMNTDRHGYLSTW
jgi:hypothetical protein